MEEEDVKKLVEQIIEDKLKGITAQFDIFPDTIKQRHIGEGVRFIRSGTAANRPTSGEQNGAVYFATDTNVLSIWNGSAWTTHTIT